MDEKYVIIPFIIILMIAFTIYGKVTADKFDVTLNVDMNGGIISMNSIG